MSAILSNDSLPLEQPADNQPNKQPKRKPTPKPAQPKKTKAEREQEKAEREANEAREKAQRKTLLIASFTAFAVATLLLALSLSHLTEAISTLTGSPVILALLLAVGIDAGMLVCESLLLLAHEDKGVRHWATGYVLATAIASACLNAFAFSLHCEYGLAPSILLGIFIPGAVLALGKVGGRAYLKAKGI